MTADISEATETRYARAIAASKRARWDIDTDVIRDRSFARSDKFLPDGLSLASELEFLRDPERVLLSQIQGRTYAAVFGLVERFINAKVLELSQHHFFGDQLALEALVRFSDEELIELVAAVDGIMKVQSEADAAYFVARAGRTFSAAEQAAIHATFLRAYRHQYIFSGVQGTRFPEILRKLVGEVQFHRVVRALAALG